METLLDFTNHLNAMLDDDQTVNELFDLYPNQHNIMMSKYHNKNISSYYLCLIHLCKEFQCEKFIVAGEILSLKPEYKAE